MRTVAAVFSFCAFFAPTALFAAEAEKPPVPAQGNAANPEDLFLRFYDLGAAAVQQRNWLDADLHFSTALKMLGNADHPKREVAEILQKKAKDQIRQNRQLVVADELMRLKQWEEAEAAYLRASKTLGLTDAIQQKINAARDAARVEKGLPTLAEELELAQARMKKGLASAQAALAKGDIAMANLLVGELEQTARAHKLDFPEGPALRASLRAMEREQAVKTKIQNEPVLDKKNRFMRIPPEKVKEQF